MEPNIESFAEVDFDSYDLKNEYECLLNYQNSQNIRILRNRLGVLRRCVTGLNTISCAASGGVESITGAIRECLIRSGMSEEEADGLITTCNLFGRFTVSISLRIALWIILNFLNRMIHITEGNIQALLNSRESERSLEATDVDGFEAIGFDAEEFLMNGDVGYEVMGE